MLIIVAFSTVGFFSARVIASALRSLFTAQQKLVSIAGAAGEQSRQLVADASLQGRQLQRKIVGTFALVFVTVLVRSVFSVILAVAHALQNVGDTCGVGFCNPCKNVYSNILGWILYTPAFQQVAMLISSPIALLVALWGMSSVSVLEQIESHVRVKVELMVPAAASTHVGKEGGYALKQGEGPLPRWKS